MNPSPHSNGSSSQDFEAIYENHSREVWAMVYARYLNADIASDIMQEAFLRLWRQREQGEEIQNPRAWLMRVTRNLAEDYAKSAFRRNGTHPPQLMNGVRSKDELPLEQLEKSELFEQLRSVLEEMPEADRQILTMRYGLDYSASQIAAALEINATAVHMRLSRARQRLAERLTAQGVVSAS